MLFIIPILKDSQLASREKTKKEQGFCAWQIKTSEKDRSMKAENNLELRKKEDWMAANTSASGLADPADGDYDDWF